MERDRFDQIARLFGARSRRDALRLLVAGALTGAVAGANDTAARRKKDRQHRKGKAGAEEVQRRCPSTCNVNCNTRKLGPGVNLTKCDLNERILDGVDLRGSNLTQACFARTSLINASFRGANLSGTCFCGSDLFGADFRGSNVTAAQLACAAVYCNTILPNGKPAVTCANGKTCCDGFCVDTRTSTANCGACGRRCQTPLDPCLEAACVAGQCGSVPDPDGTACEVNGETGVCCAAGSGATCVAGTICCSDAQCDPGETCCGGLCYNLKRDIAHCGACDTACPELQSDACSDGVCTCGGGPVCSTQPFQVCRGGMCVHL
ncbi:MAG: pentapeptide repeat-containing protein [Thermomicrobiales bacterium]